MRKYETDPNVRISRRGLIMAGASFALPGVSWADNAKHGPAMGIPGLYRGTVIEVGKRGAVEKTRVDPSAVRSMLSAGMKQLTGAPEESLAWKRFFKPGEVVGIKVSPVGRPYAI